MNQTVKKKKAKKTVRKKLTTATLSDIQKASENIDKFCNEFGAVLTTSNKKKGLNEIIWTSRFTRNHVQLKVVTGANPLDVMMQSSEFCYEKRATLGL